MPSTRPDATESAPYYATYISQVPDGDVRAFLETQAPDAATFLSGISEERSLHRYADGKWSIREVLSHINDCERLFVFRAFWFARGLESEMPSFDQDVAIAYAGADARPWSSHVDEFHALRASTVKFYRSLPAEAWSKRGVASGNPVTVRALAWITAGHAAHHLRLLRERYM